jgi:class 3 adenylate cyclase
VTVDELPVGTVTFLFTDIEGSTRLLKLLRDRYGEALEDHQGILRAAFAENGGSRDRHAGRLLLRRFPASQGRGIGGDRVSAPSRGALLAG